MSQLVRGCRIRSDIDHCSVNVKKTVDTQSSHRIGGEIKMFALCCKAAHNTYFGLGLQSSKVIKYTSLYQIITWMFYVLNIHLLLDVAIFSLFSSIEIHVPIMQHVVHHFGFGFKWWKGHKPEGFLRSPAVGPNEVSQPAKESRQSHDEMNWHIKSSWWFQPHLEKYESKWKSSPKIGVENEKYLSCHHLEIFLVSTLS